MTSIDRVLNAVRSATGHEPRPSGNGWSCLCPAHDDHKPSLSVRVGDDGRVLVKCMSRDCDFNDIAAALGLTPKDFFPDDGSMPSLATGRDSKPKAGRKHQSPTKTYPTCKAAIEALETRLGERSATWTYHNADGKPVGAAVRWDKVDGKDFRPLALTPDGWIIGAMPEPRPLYQLNDVLRSDPSAVVFVVEGEKAADVMHSLSLLATTSSGGSNAASKTNWTPLAGRSVVIMPDNDEPGLKYAQQVAGIVTKLDPPATVRLINLADHWPDLPKGGDVADWCDAHDAVESETLRARLQSLADQSPDWQPPTAGDGEKVPNQFGNSDNRAGSQRSADGTTSGNAGTRRAVLQSFADVAPEQLRWLWPGRIPSGMLTVISGNPAAGKSFLMADIIARITTGSPWPDGGDARPPGDVILINVEDAVSVCQRPRLDAAGADSSRVHRIERIELTMENAAVEQRTFNILQAAVDLRDAARQVAYLRLIVLDPLAAFLAGVRSNDQGDIRSALSPLVVLAEELDVAIVFVHHNRKSCGSHSSERLAGSLQIGATMRQVWEVFADPEDKDRRLFVAGKNSNARDRGGLAFRVVDSPIPLSDAGFFVGRVEWQEGLLKESADDIAFQSLDSEDRDSWPVEWLRDALKGGPRPTRDIQQAAKQEGITDKQLRTARKRLGVHPTKASFEGGWVLALSAE